MPNETLDQPAGLSPEVNYAHTEALLDEAKRLMEAGNPWLALVKKSEAIGLKPLTKFTSMAKQDFGKRRDLKDMGFPLSDTHKGNFKPEAAARLYPSEEGGEAMHASIIEAAKRTVGEPETGAQQQAREAADKVTKKAFELQAQRAFDEVGHYYIHAGYVAARAGNGDLLVADATPDHLSELAEAGYSESRTSMNVPFSADVESRRDVRWDVGQQETNERIS